MKKQQEIEDFLDTFLKLPIKYRVEVENEPMFRQHSLAYFVSIFEHLRDDLDADLDPGFSATAADYYEQFYGDEQPFISTRHMLVATVAQLKRLSGD